MSTATAPQPVARKVSRYPREKGLHSESVKVEQRASFVQPPIEEKMENPMAIEPVDRIEEDELETLAFLEEPVKIHIFQSNDAAFAPLCTEFISNRGIPAEVLFKNGWVQMGYLPRGQTIYVKRKTLAQLASNRVDQIQTRVERQPQSDPINHTTPVTTRTFQFQVIEDRNPKGAAWLERLLYRRI